jgi:hypothetical protein
VLASFRPLPVRKGGATKRITCVAGGSAGFVCTASSTIGFPAGQPFFSAQWTDPTRLCIIQSIKVGAMVTAASSAGSYTSLFDLAAYVLRNYTVPITGSLTTSLLPFAKATQDMRSSMGQTSPWGDMRFLTSITNCPSVVPDIASSANTVAGAGVSNGVYVADSKPFARIQGFFSDSSTVANIVRQVFPAPNPAELYVRDHKDHHPLSLGQYEGIVITNPLAIASGAPGDDIAAAFNVLVQFEWTEAPNPAASVVVPTMPGGTY